MKIINSIKTFFLKYKIKTQNNGIEFRIAQTQDEKDEVYKLRYSVYCEEKKYLKVSDYPDGLEFDKYDPISDHFIALNKIGKIVGTLRLVPRDNNLFNEKRIPLEYYTDIENHINSKSVVSELSRFTIDKNYRTKYSINFGLIKRATLFALAEGITHFAISTSVNSKNYFERFGFHQIGESYIYQKLQYKLPSITMITSIQKGLKKMRDSNIGFYDYFISK
ncbi:MAG: GNAT family N-acyltransferase [Candidatus Kerfeldbacteria bacterium]